MGRIVTSLGESLVEQITLEIKLCESESFSNEE